MSRICYIFYIIYETKLDTFISFTNFVLKYSFIKIIKFDMKYLQKGIKYLK